MKTTSEEIIEKKYRYFMILLYKDSEIYNYNDILFDLKGSFKNYAYIEHSPECEEKKSHIHFILSLDNPRSISGLSKRLNLPINYIQNVKSLRASCRYLIHKDNEEKIQYDISKVRVSNSFKSTFFGAFDDLKSDDEILDDIYLFIYDHKEMSSVELEVCLSLYVCRCGNQYERVFKRYYNSIVKKINSLEYN